MISDLRINELRKISHPSLMKAELIGILDEIVALRRVAEAAEKHAEDMARKGIGEYIPFELARCLVLWRNPGGPGDE